jgi:hypothetical protein
VKNPQNTLVLEAEIMKIPHNKAIRIGGKGILLYITIQFNSEEEENGGGGREIGINDHSKTETCERSFRATSQLYIVSGFSALSV